MCARSLGSSRFFIDARFQQARRHDVTDDGSQRERASGQSSREFMNAASQLHSQSSLDTHERAASIGLAHTQHIHTHLGTCSDCGHGCTLNNKPVVPFICVSIAAPFVPYSIHIQTNEFIWVRSQSKPGERAKLDLKRAARSSSLLSYD